MTFGFIKENCGQVQGHRFRKCGYGGHQYDNGYTERCGFYTKKACNSKNCPLFNKKRGYEKRIKALTLIQ